MKKRYLGLFLGAVVVALLLSTIRHAPGSKTPAASPAAETPVVAMRIEIAEGVVSPASASVAKDHRVSLEIVNRGTRAASVRLAGYEDRVSADLAPGATRRLEFLADRPGEDFPWLVDGRPSGRFVVAGAHLAERRR